jgi:hypothetical protein
MICNSDLPKGIMTWIDLKAAVRNVLEALRFGRLSTDSATAELYASKRCADLQFAKNSQVQVRVS